MKQITGRDKVIARFLYKEFVEYTPQFKIFLAANFRPKITGDEALWNRIHVVPFNKRIPKERQDKNLEAGLRKELPGILSWAVMGCKHWLEDGSLKPSDSVREALMIYRAEADVVQGFIDKHCVVDENAFVAFGDLYEKWMEYAGKRKADPGSDKAFAMALNEKGFRTELKNIGGNPQRIRIGLKLRTHPRPSRAVMEEQILHSYEHREDRDGGKSGKQGGGPRSITDNRCNTFFPLLLPSPGESFRSLVGGKLPNPSMGKNCYTRNLLLTFFPMPSRPVRMARGFPSGPAGSAFVFKAIRWAGCQGHTFSLPISSGSQIGRRL